MSNKITEEQTKLWSVEHFSLKPKTREKYNREPQLPAVAAIAAVVVAAAEPFWSAVAVATVAACRPAS